MIKVAANKAFKLFSLNNIKKSQYSTQVSNKLCNLISQSYLKLEGADQISFLQGMTTNHIKNWFDKAEDKIIYTGILSPQGRVLFDAFLYRQEDDSLILETHKDNLSPLRSHLLKYRLLSQVDIDDATDSFSTLFSFGSNPLKLSENGIVVKDPRVLDFGTRYLISKNKEQDLDTVSELDYTMERYRLGIPEGPFEIRTNQALPMESNMELMNGVHFSKGCYIGQELTTRTKHRGVIRKRVVPITYDTSSSSDLTPQDLYASGSKRSVGKLLSTLNGRGLALVKLTNVNDTLSTKSDDGNITNFKCEVPNWWPSSIMENVEAQQ